MPALTITTANVVPGAGATTINATAGDTLTIGLAVYQAADGDYEPADHATASPSTAAGISLTNCVAGQPCTILTKGDLAFGSILTAGEVYMLGNTGQILPIGDITTNDYATLLGIATSGTTMKVNPIASSTQRA